MSAPHPSRPTVLTRPNAPPAASPITLRSPASSRDSSPADPVVNSSTSGSASAGSRGMRSRKNSHEVSPQRQSNLANTTPSAAAIQRALSGAGVPQLQPTVTTETTSRIPRSQRSNNQEGSKDTPSWPTSPRLKSPSPSSSSRKTSGKNQRKQVENGTPSIVLQRVATDPASETSKDGEGNNTKSSTTSRIASTMSTLETVQESVPPTPAQESKIPESSDEKKSEYFSPGSDDERPQTAFQVKRSMAESSKSSSDINSRKEMSPTRARVATSSSIASVEPKSLAEPALKNMTVETETVTSIPQASIAAADRNIRTDSSGTLRVKASNETIRPKKERKKAAKKAPSITSGPPSTRSEVFENRVKKEMEDATSDDSDETFVYESNPPEPPARRSRHHSRTPSGASLASMQERGMIRSIAGALDSVRPLQKPRSMKFSSNTSNYGTADEEPEYRDGTIRANNRNGSQQIGRHSRVATGQSILLDEENPLFAPASKTKSLTAVGGRSTTAARFAAQQLRATSMKRSDGYSSMDMEAEAADDERTPLINGTGTVRTPGRSRNARTGRYRYVESRPPPPRRGLFARFAGCLLILITVTVLIIGVCCFLFAMSKPLMDVNVVEINGVIATEQELMFDLVVSAMNPNLVPITVSQIDVECFAHSKFAGSGKWWREHGRGPTGNDTDALIPSQVQRITARLLRRKPRSALSKRELDLIISDPPAEKDPAAKPSLLLGSILKFDNPLIFDGSFWRRQDLYSVGSLRLPKPANKTEAGGTERWERVLKHEFELQIRGVLTYTIPLGGKSISVPINGVTIVKGNGGDEDDDVGDVPGGE